MSLAKKICSKFLRCITPPYHMGYPTWEPWRGAVARIHIHPTAIIAPNASVGFWGNHVVSGHINVEIGEDSHIFSSLNLLRPEAKITIGKRCQLGNVLFACAEAIEVGDDVIMAWGINILDSNHHSLDWNERQHDVMLGRQDHLAGRPLGSSQNWDSIARKKVSIGDKCWIGCNVTILKGVTLHEGAVVGAGSVVTGDVAAWDVVAGNPAQSIKAHCNQQKTQWNTDSGK